MEHKDYRLAAIMYTDIVGFSRMMESDEVGTLKLMDFHNRLVGEKVKNFGGKIIKTIGDAFLVEFPTANNAVKCAIEVQQELERFNAEKPRTGLVLRIGVHLGDIYFSENDALGEGINIASRLQNLCRPGRVCISGEVHTLVSKKIELPIQPLGAVQLKNISRGITAFEVMTNGAAEALPAPGAGSSLMSGSFTPAELAAVGSPAAPTADFSGQPDIQALRSFVFQSIKQAGRRLSVEEMKQRLSPELRGSAADAYLETLADGGFLVRGAPVAPNAAWTPPAPPAGPKLEMRFERAPGGRAEESFENRIERHIEQGIENFISGRGMAAGEQRGPSYEQYMEQVDRRLQKEEESFRGHLMPYLAVNGGLWLIWGLTSFLGFPWPLIVMGAWGIGLATHWGKLRERKREAAQMKALPPLDPKQFGLVRSLFKERRSWNGHLISNLAVSAFLVGLNVLTTLGGGGPLVPWAVFPVGGMAIGLFSHLPSFKRKEQEILEAIAAEGLPLDALTDPSKLPKALPGQKAPVAAGPIAQEAERIRTRIIRQASGMKGNNPLGDDFEAVLENYVNQIKELSVRDREIDGILAALPVGDLDRELDQLNSELERCSDERMRVEYEKSVEQVGKQKKAYGEMVSEQKVLKLRLNNALNSLKQLEIDLARMRSLSAGADVAAASAIKAKSGELSHYLSDLRAGYQEIDALEKDAFGTMASGQQLGESASPTPSEGKAD